MTPRLLYIPRENVHEVQGAIRAHNFFKELQFKLDLTLLNDWNPNFRFDFKNIYYWNKLIRYGNRTGSSKKILIENPLNIYQLKIFKLLKFKFIIDVRDDLNLHASSMGIHVSDSLKFSRQYVNLANFELADKVIVPSRGLANYYLDMYKELESKKFLIIPNASDPGYMVPTEFPKNPTVGIVGGLNYGQGFDIFLDAAVIVKKRIPGLLVKCAFNTIPQTENLRQKILDEYPYEWIEFRNDVYYSKNAPDFYSNLSICVIPRRNSQINKLATPSKLFDSMSASRPLVVTNLDEQAQIVTKAKCGFVSDFSPESIADHIIQLLSAPDLMQRMGRNGRRAVEKEHNWNSRVQEIVDNVFK